jgi:aminopeptidase-like protein
LNVSDPAVGPLGDALYDLVAELYPICRSITGDGVRATLQIVGRRLPLEVHEVASGTPVLDWTVPPEWNIGEAFIADSSGRRVVDFAECNLHVVSYSTAVDAVMSLEALRPHLHSLPDRPALIPYRTTYYEENWGFCLSQQQLDTLDDGLYHVRIDSTLQPGSLSYGEVVVAGQLDDEILVSTHICHPSLADDNLSGVAIATLLAERLLSGTPPRHTFRFLFAPGTIGAITWLAGNRQSVAKIRHGLTLTCLGDAHPFTYKRTFAGTEVIDRAAAHVLAACGSDHQLIDFFPYGYDERQYNAPGFRTAVGSLMRGRHGQFPEYHTSADNLSFVSAERLAESFNVLAGVLGVVDADRSMLNTQPFGEPQLGKRGLYGALGGTNLPDGQLAMLWVLNMSDGNHSLLDIAERSGIRFETIEATASLLAQFQLLTEVAPPRVETKLGS